MRPPICDVCHLDQYADVQGQSSPRSEAASRQFVTREFADYTPLPSGMAGHPRGLLWLCPECDRASADLLELLSTQAVRIARDRRGLHPSG